MLDVGVGTARFAFELARAGAGSALRTGDAYDFPLATHEWGSFDLVWSRLLLEHVAPAKRADASCWLPLAWAEGRR